MRIIFDEGEFNEMNGSNGEVFEGSYEVKVDKDADKDLYNTLYDFCLNRNNYVKSMSMMSNKELCLYYLNKISEDDNKDLFILILLLAQFSHDKAYLKSYLDEIEESYLKTIEVINSYNEYKSKEE